MQRSVFLPDYFNFSTISMFQRYYLMVQRITVRVFLYALRAISLNPTMIGKGTVQKKTTPG